MADALAIIRRMQRQAARREPGGSIERDTEPPDVDDSGLEPTSAGAGDGDEAAAAKSAHAGPVVVHGPLDATTLLDDQAVAALVAAGLVMELEDGRRVARDLAVGEVLSWPLGVMDEDGLPLPYLRNGSPVVPFTAADGWKWWRGGLDSDDVAAQLQAAQQGS